MTDEAQATASNVTKLVPGKTDKELADELRAEMITALQPVLALMDKFTAAGMNVAYTTGIDFMGKTCITMVHVSKRL